MLNFNELKNASDICFHLSFLHQKAILETFYLISFFYKTCLPSNLFQQQTSSKLVRTIWVQYTQLNLTEMSENIFSDMFADCHLLRKERPDHLKSLSLH